MGMLLVILISIACSGVFVTSNYIERQRCTRPSDDDLLMQLAAAKNSCSNDSYEMVSKEQLHLSVEGSLNDCGFENASRMERQRGPAPW